MKSALKLVLILMALVMPLAAGCGDGGSEDGTDAAGGSKVVLKDSKFSPDRITVEQGTTVTWTNEDSTDHNVTEVNGVFKSENFGKGETFTYTFDKPGTYNYACTLHPPSMKGAVVVTEPGA